MGLGAGMLGYGGTAAEQYDDEWKERSNDGEGTTSHDLVRLKVW
jgi:hypothetical protein